MLGGDALKLSGHVSTPPQKRMTRQHTMISDTYLLPCLRAFVEE